jgi:hypothetical protein
MENLIGDGLFIKVATRPKVSQNRSNRFRWVLSKQSPIITGEFEKVGHDFMNISKVHRATVWGFVLMKSLVLSYSDGVDARDVA